LGFDLSSPGDGDIVDDHLKGLMQQLGNAINESLSESEGIAEVIGEIKKEGYDVFLVLEATIGFNRRDSEGDDPLTPEIKSGKTEQLSFTDQDHAFLRALKITVDE
jgi:hypothetical protein